MEKPNLLSCYQKIGSLQDKLRHLQERFGFSNITGVIHSAQIDLQQVQRLTPLLTVCSFRRSGQRDFLTQSFISNSYDSLLVVL